jgi:LuxR family maltose regulon positive regulatory protein
VVAARDKLVSTATASTMTMVVLKTKIHRPRIQPGLVSRPYLIARLTDGLHRKLALISAPAGFGKTTLVNEWAHNCGHPVAWLSLDQEDNDPVRFWTYLIAACQTIRADLGQGIHDLLQSPQPISAHSVLVPLINDIATLAKEFVLVLDDYHLISQRTIHDGMAFLLDHLPDQMHLVIITRADPPLPLARLRVQGQLNQVREADLRFTVKEATVFFRRALDVELGDSEIATLYTRTEGWIASLQLAALSMQGRHDMADFIRSFDGSHRYVIDYLAEEVLRRQSDDIRGFVRQTTILERLSVPLCEAVTGNDASEALLTQLERANLFLIPLDDKREWYRYHRLFADFVRQQSGAEYQRPLHRKAAKWYEAHNLLPEAIHHALAAQDAPQAGRLILLAAQDVINSGQNATLQGWLDALPDELVRANYELALLKAWMSMIRGQDQIAKRYIQSAQNALPEDAPQSARGGVIGLQAFFARLYGDAQDSISLSKKALELIGDADPFANSMILLNLIEVQQLIGDIDAAIQTCHQVIAMDSKMGTHIAPIGAVSQLALLLGERGRLRQAIDLCQQTIARCVDDQGNPLSSASPVSVCLGRLYFEANDLEKARLYLLDGLTLGKALSTIGIIRLGQLWLAKLQWATGETEMAWATLRKAQRIEAQLPPNLAFTELAKAVEADFLFQEGDVQAATRLAKTVDLSAEVIPGYLIQAEHWPYAHMLLAQNRHADLQALLADLKRSAYQQDLRVSLIRVYILQALLEHALDHPDSAQEHLVQAVHLAAPEGYRRPFLEGGQRLAEMLPKARHIAPAFVDDLLAAVKADHTGLVAPSLPGSQIPPSTTLVEPLNERESQILRLVANGLSNPDIARELFLTVNTVKWYLKHIYTKLDVHSRAAAVSRARDLELL